ncbi:MULTISPECIES: DUF1643 domain-containing protein [Gammaproteobacteria]|uniref:DUF1643 domain-containing protein n=1 Tax=Gammaproteobacteria TaxID=1236 RepID=UPI000DF8060B|nr:MULTISPECIES: DUF1643 domain-containing protein [Gammaproteobacteria]QJS05528.1 hypothetical protein [Psychrobacter sp.]RDD47988.1 DUF1643 domain-containing protein [Aeromonas sp. ARM81]
MKKSADISECQKYRYSLERVWDETKPLIGFIGLNPSTADHLEDDPTICRCINFAKLWGAGGIYMTNLFAYRATSPSDMFEQENSIGLENDKYLSQLSSKTSKTVVCWGNDGAHKNRANEVKKLLKGDLFCLAINKTGEPKHPLYVSGSTELMPYKRVSNN